MQAEVHSLREIRPRYFLQRFTSPPFAFQPGQFVMVKPSGTLDPFLPRAYSILRIQGKGRREAAVEILYRVVGRGTMALSSLRPGERVDLLGPLGNSYQVPPMLQTALLVAGGIGVPPVVALAERLAASGFRVVGRPRLVAFLGGRTANDVLCVTDLRKGGAKVHVATEDGSLGSTGLVTDLLEAYLRSTAGGERSTIYACGPHPMLQAVATLAAQFHIPCQVSMEASMACGFGACMGCVIPVQSSGFRVWKRKPSVNRELSTVNQRSYKLCCKDGPIFDAQEVAW